MNKLYEKWVAIEGSIFTERKVQKKLLSGTVVIVPESVAFNMRSDIAEHIVKLHNENLLKTKQNCS